MLANVIFYTLGGAIVIWVSDKLIPGITFTGDLKTLILAGLVLGIFNAILKPIIKKLTWPLRILTLGLFNFVINMVILELVDVLFPELVISGLWPLFLGSLLLAVTAGFFHEAF